MRRFALLTFLLGALAAFSITPVDALVSAPSEVVETIDSLTRLDMVDYFRSGSERPSKNAFGGSARVVALDSASVSVSTSLASTVRIVLIPAKTDTLLMVINTLQTPAPDSSVKFYDSHWRPLRTPAILAWPRQGQWLTPEGRANRKDFENAFPFVLAEATYSPDSRVLTISNTMDAYFPEEEWNNYASWIHPTLSYAWDGKKFRLIKQ